MCVLSSTYLTLASFSLLTATSEKLRTSEQESRRLTTELDTTRRAHETDKAHATSLESKLNFQAIRLQGLERQLESFTEIKKLAEDAKKERDELLLRVKDLEEKLEAQDEKLNALG